VSRRLDRYIVLELTAIVDQPIGLGILKEEFKVDKSKEEYSE